MDVALVHSRAVAGIESPPVTVEIHLSGGLPSMTVVGLAETAVKESRDRVRSAVLSNGFAFPVGRITINLAPADLPKEGGRYDLAIAVGLLVASVWCWAIIVDKSMLYTRVKLEMNRFERVFWSGQSLEELYQQMSEKPAIGLGAVFVAAMKEWKRSHEQNAASFIGVQGRLDKVLDVAIARESETLEKRLSFLATVGSAAPFIGLFGTVWGIMNAFTAIAQASSTNLSVVAGPIAEALFATALGLIAAIPAVIAYNKISSDLTRYAGRLEAFSNEFGAILSRQLEEKG